MELRPTFKNLREAPELEQLIEFGKLFDKYNREDWSDLKNKQDFERVYSLKDEDRNVFEKVYCDGRDCAVSMSYALLAINSVEEYPTLASLVDNFDTGWVHDASKMAEHLIIAEYRAKLLPNCPWSVKAMITLAKKEIELLKSIKNIINKLKKSNQYFSDKGISRMTLKGRGKTITIGGSLAALLSIIGYGIKLKFGNPKSTAPQVTTTVEQSVKNTPSNQVSITVSPQFTNTVNAVPKETRSAQASNNRSKILDYKKMYLEKMNLYNSRFSGMDYSTEYPNCKHRFMSRFREGKASLDEILTAGRLANFEQDAIRFVNNQLPESTKVSNTCSHSMEFER